MNQQTLLLDETSGMSSEVLGADEAVLRLGDRQFVLNYESAYELAFRMAHLLNEMSHQDDSKKTMLS